MRSDNFTQSPMLGTRATRTPGGSDARVRRLIVCAAALLAGACDGTTTPPTSPTSPPSPTLPGTPSGGGMPAPPSNGATGERAELEALYGAAASSMADAIGARRRAANALLTSDAVAVVAAELDAGISVPDAANRDVSRASTARASLESASRETASREVVTSGGRDWLIETRAVSEPWFDAASTTLRVTQDFTVAVTPLGISGKAYRTQASYAFDLPACPSAAGTSSGRLLATGRSWQRMNAPAGEGADSATADRRRETRVDGEVLLRVDDGAELAGVDLALNVSAAWDNGTGAPLRGTGRLVWPGAGPSVFAASYDGARISARTGDFDAIDALGYGPADRYALAMDLAGQQAQAARTLWRGGRCVDVLLVRGYTARTILPGATVPFGPEARSRVDRTTVASAMLLARPEVGVIVPLVPVRHPAMFSFTMPDEPTIVEFRATSRRGIGTLRLPFLRAIPDSATITYSATSSYLFDRKGPGGQGSMTGSISGRMELSSKVRFVFDYAEGDATYYKVVADSRITVGGQAAVDARMRNEDVSWRLSLAGNGSTRNPRQDEDAPLVQGRTVSPEDFRPGAEPGTLKVTRVGLRYDYELSLRVGQINADYTESAVSRTACGAGEMAESSTRYDNRTRTTTETNLYGRNAQGTSCGYAGPDGTWTSTAAAPFTWGSIFFDRTQRQPGNDIGALVRGSWVVGEPTPMGQESAQVVGCDKVTTYDPTQLGTKVLAIGHAPPSGLGGSWDSGGVTCRLQYTIGWTLPLP